MRRTVFVAACLATMAAPASAAIKLVTIAGTVSTGYDTAGVFGPAMTSLDGAAFVATFRYDTSLGARVGTPGIAEELYGGTAFISAPATPVTYSSLTINGVELHVRAAQQGSVYVRSTDASYAAVDQTGVGSTQTVIVLQAIGYVPNAAEIDADIAMQSILNDGSYFVYQSYDFSSGVLTNYANAQLGGSSGMTISVTDAVPEPATWAMMIAGFGLAGFAARRRTTSVTA